MNYLISLYNILQHPENRKAPLQTLARIVWWKVNTLFFDYRVIYPLTEKYWCICPPESSYAGLVVYCHRPEPEVSAFIENFVQKGDTVVDVGANIGVISLLAASRSAKKVYAFEPDARVYSSLVENVEYNQALGTIETWPVALSNKNGRITFAPSATTETSHIAQTAEKGKSVPSQTLDSFFSKKRVKQAQLVKIDVEGAEMLVLQGAQRILSEQRIDCLSLELNSKNTEYGSSHEAIIELLRAHKYKVLEFSDASFRSLERLPQQTDTVNVLAVKNQKIAQKVHKAWKAYVAESHL